MSTTQRSLHSYRPFIDLNFKLTEVRHIIERAQAYDSSLIGVVDAAEYIYKKLDSDFVDNIQSCVRFIEQNTKPEEE